MSYYIKNNAGELLNYDKRDTLSEIQELAEDLLRVLPRCCGRGWRVMDDPFKFFNQFGLLPTYKRVCSLCNGTIKQGDSYRVVSREPKEKVWCMGCVKTINQSSQEGEKA